MLRRLILLSPFVLRPFAPMPTSFCLFGLTLVSRSSFLLKSCKENVLTSSAAKLRVSFFFPHRTGMLIPTSASGASIAHGCFATLALPLLQRPRFPPIPPQHCQRLPKNILLIFAKRSFSGARSEAPF